MACRVEALVGRGDIVSAALGSQHTLFLDSQGAVFSCGENKEVSRQLHHLVMRSHFRQQNRMLCILSYPCLINGVYDCATSHNWQLRDRLLTQSSQFTRKHLTSVFTVFLRQTADDCSTRKP